MTLCRKHIYVLLLSSLLMVVTFNKEVLAKHIVLVQPLEAFDLSFALEETDVLSIIGTPLLDEEYARKMNTKYKKGTICKVDFTSQDSLTAFEVHIEKLKGCVDYIQVQTGKIDYVLGNLEETVVASALLNEYLGIRNPNPTQSYVDMRDKIAMKRQLRRRGLVKAPYFLDKDVISKHEAIKFAKQTGFPLFIKPRGEAGSKGCAKIFSLKELELFFNSKKALTGYDIEEYIDQKTIQIDGVVREGELLFLSAAELLNTCANWAKNTRLNLIGTLITEPSKVEMIKKFTHDVMQSFDYANGVFHLEAFYDDRNESLTFLEIAPRCGGAYTVPMNQQFFGINLLREGILALLNRPSDIVAPMGYMDPKFNPNKSIIGALIGRNPNKQKKIKNLIFPKLPGNVKFLYQPKIGDFTREKSAYMVYHAVIELLCECESNKVDQVAKLLDNKVLIEYE